LIRKQKYTNRLINEKSPYLLQHAHNPVDWYSWSDEAFEKAKTENKPIFLSIGYSTCHWCHVMERESFEDEEVAKILNENFVSIKVDREERPDIDQIYMNVCQAMTGSGGWPMTIVMTPDKKPFFAGTYFPKDDKWGRAGLMSILPRLAELWKNDRERIYDVASGVVNAINSHKRSAVGSLDKDTLEKTYRQLSNDFDEKYGGFGQAPKFPTAHKIIFLLRYWKQIGKAYALEMAEKTLDSMARGGIYDHIGFGFHRYSTDRLWLVPHFEKMLYDNAILAYAYVEAFQATSKEKYAEIARQILDYVDHNMTSPEGGFYSAEDADSEEVEGKFYIWDLKEVKQILGEQDGEFFCRVYNISEKGNFEGKNIPNLINASLQDIAREEDMDLQELKNRLYPLRDKLFNYREKRIRPYKDDKILTSWNGLMIAALAKGFKVFREEKLAQRAEKAAKFILDKLIREDGRLLACYRHGHAAYPGYIDDYAFFIWSLIELYEATFNTLYLQKALALNDDMIRLFWDEKDGGFYFYGSDSEELISRPKEIHDGAIPSGNSVAALNLLKLARLTGREELNEKAYQIFSAFAGEVSAYPMAYTNLMCALLFAFGISREIVITGDLASESTKSMLALVRSVYMPETVVLFKPEGHEDEFLKQLVPKIQEMKSLEKGKATAYVCEHYTCKAPTSDLQRLREILTVPMNNTSVDIK